MGTTNNTSMNPVAFEDEWAGESPFGEAAWSGETEYEGAAHEGAPSAWAGETSWAGESSWEGTAFEDEWTGETSAQAGAFGAGAFEDEWTGETPWAGETSWEGTAFEDEWTGETSFQGGGFEAGAFEDEAGAFEGEWSGETAWAGESSWEGTAFEDEWAGEAGAFEDEWTGEAGAFEDEWTGENAAGSDQFLPLLAPLIAKAVPFIAKAAAPLVKSAIPMAKQALGGVVRGILGGRRPPRRRPSRPIGAAPGRPPRPPMAMPPAPPMPGMGGMPGAANNTGPWRSARAGRRATVAGLLRQLAGVLGNGESEASQAEAAFFGTSESIGEIAANPMAHEAALTEVLAAEAAHAGSEAEAEALLAAALPVTIRIMGGARVVRPVMPGLLDANTRMVRSMRRSGPGGRQLLRLVPAIQRRTVASLRALDGSGPISPGLVDRVMAGHAARVLGTPRLCRQALVRNTAIRQATVGRRARTY